LVAFQLTFGATLFEVDSSKLIQLYALDSDWFLDLAKVRSSYDVLRSCQHFTIYFAFYYCRASTTMKTLISQYYPILEDKF